MNHGVGNTPLIQLHELAGEIIQGTVLIKDESANPTGTHKDRKSVFVIEKAIQDGVDTLVIITSGNAGYSLATIAQDTRLRIVTIVSNTISPSILEKLHQTKAEVISVDLTRSFTSPDIIALARRSASEKIRDVTNAGHAAYKNLYAEIDAKKPDLIITPLGSGELYLGLHEGMMESNSTTTLLGVHPKANESMADKLCTRFRPLQGNILAEQMRGASHGTLRGRADITEADIQWCIQNAPDGLNAEPSALVPLQMIKRLDRADQKIIMISTGKGLQ